MNRSLVFPVSFLAAVSVGFGIAAIASAQVTGGPSQVTFTIKCGEDDQGSGRFEIVGEKCSGSPNSDKKFEALDDANTAWSQTFGCYCENEPSATCEKTFAPAEPFSASDLDPGGDCTYEHIGACPDNKYKHLHRVTCVKFIAWTLSCSDC
ncbi:hypothetical protein Pla86_34770 [Planctomycetes bacterium Pla86]|uniref:Uncharacterized protein n=2 Tax=Engelhardtia mirabilis TaxID=2528011 RepID=A0A518BN66_9BACT|nr:hypothetical protein Pla133_34790 [Planctomycetes bacterium Pla133]QDV02708.1 hypothetical protein Pla86_34770 [Planctomycetes bacterium Pla86]